MRPLPLSFNHFRSLSFRATGFIPLADRIWGDRFLQELAQLEEQDIALYAQGLERGEAHQRIVFDFDYKDFSEVITWLLFARESVCFYIYPLDFFHQGFWLGEPGPERSDLVKHEE